MASENKRRKIQPTIGQPLTVAQRLTLTFCDSQDLKEDDIVAVPRNGDRFDFGVVTAVNENTVSCLLGREPLLKKELPFILCGRLPASESSIDITSNDGFLERVDNLEKSSRDLHTYIQRADVTLLTIPVRTMISFVQSHIASSLAWIARRQHLSSSDLGGTASIVPFAREDFLKEVISSEKRAAELQSEAMLKITQAHEEKWKMLNDLISKTSSVNDRGAEAD